MLSGMNEARENLAFSHKIISHLKMDDLTYTHISTLLPDRENFVISPFGIQFGQVKPCDLVHFKLDGTLMPRQRAESYHDHLSWVFGEKAIEKFSGWKFEKEQPFNKTGFSIHSSIYKARGDVSSVIHLHTKESIAVSASKQGLLPVSQHALHFYEGVSYHHYDSLILTQQQEEALLIKDLGTNNVMFLRNHGFITVGKTIWEALFYAYHLQKACEVQVLCGQDLIIPSEEVCKKAKKDLLSFEKDLGRRDFESYKSVL